MAYAPIAQAKDLTAYPTQHRRRYTEAGSPTQCFLPSCRKAFDGVCVHSEDGHYYCSQACIDAGRTIDLRFVEGSRQGGIKYYPRRW